jgi:hypothetical protein
MNIKTTLILFGVLCLALGVFAILQIFEVLTPAELEEKEKYLLPSLNDTFSKVKTEDFTRLSVERAAEGKDLAMRLEFEKEGKDWRMVAPAKVRTDSSAVTRLIDQLVTARKEKGAKLGKNLADYGLDQPRVTVTLYRGDKETTVKLGQELPGKDAVVYAVTSDAPKAPTAISKSSIDKAFASVADFRDKKLFGSSFDVQALRLAPAGQQAIEFEKADRDWRFKEPKLGEADAKAVDDLNLNVTGIAVEKTSDFIADGPFDDAALAKYGLTKDKANTIIIRRKSPDDAKKMVEETLLIGARDPEVANAAQRQRAGRLIGDVAATMPTAFAAVAALQAREKQDQELGGHFAKLADDNTVVRIDAKHIKNFEKKADEFRSRSLAKVDAQKADAINLTSGTESLRLRRPRLKTEAGAAVAAEWDLYTDTRAKAKTHLDMVPRLIDALNKIELASAKHFLDDSAKQREWFGMDTIDFGLDKPQAEVHLWLDSLKRDKDGKPEGEGEPKLKDESAKKPYLKLAIGRKDEKRGVVYVRRQVEDGDVAILAVPDPYLSASATPPQPPIPGQPPPPEMRESVSLTEKATAGYMAFRDHTLPSFTMTNASKLLVQRGGATYEASKEEKKDDKGAPDIKWLLKKPVEGKSQGVELLLSQLSTLSAEKLVTDRPTERDLKEVFGLADQPLWKATVTVTDKDDKKKSGEYTYIVGKKTPAEGKNANHFYVRMEVKPTEGPPPEANQFVFLLPWFAMQGLDAELRDGMVFEEEKSAKPVELTVTWNKLDKDKKLVESKLVLAHQPEKEGSATKVWAVQSLTVGGKDAKGELPKLDQEKIDQLLGTTPSLRFGLLHLSPLKTAHFVVHNGKPVPQHRLDPAKKDAPPLLVADIKYDSKAVRTLVIGEKWEPKETEFPGLHPRAFHYATASTLANAVFVLEERDLKPLLDGPEFFKAGEKVAGR